MAKSDIAIYIFFNGRERKRAPALTGVERKSLSDAGNTVNKALGKVKVKCVTEANDLIYCGAALETEMLGIKNMKRRVEKQL